MKKFLIWAVLLASILSCGKENGSSTVDDSGGNPTTEKPAAGTYLLPVIETSDIHGHLVKVDGSDVHYCLAYIAKQANDIRSRGGEYDGKRLLLVDGGDIYQGASISNLLKGRPVYTSLDMMGYDAVALGNHEFDWGFENIVDPDATLPDYEWQGSRRENLVPLVCANLYQNGDRVPRTKDYVIVEKTAFDSKGQPLDVKIGIVGFAYDYASSIMTSKFTGLGYTIDYNLQIANNIAYELESSGQCDATVLLIHGGAQAAAEALGEGSVIDLVLGGHSHARLSGVAGNGVPYLQGGSYCNYYAYADMKFTVDDKGESSFTSVQNKNVRTVDPSADLRKDNLDELIVSVSDEALFDISEQLSEVVGYIDVDATRYYLAGSGDRASMMSNWMCDIMRRIGEADVSFVNNGGIRIDFPLNGDTVRNITVANVYEIFPFDNAIYVYDITYEDLLTLLKYSMTAGGRSLFWGILGIDCYYTSSGEIRSLEKDGTLIYNDGSWTDDWAARTLTLSVSEFLATSQRVDYDTGIPNPLIDWNETSKLRYNNLQDNENAVSVLREEADGSGGHLWIDSEPHFILVD